MWKIGAGVQRGCKKLIWLQEGLLHHAMFDSWICDCGNYCVYNEKKTTK